MNSCTAAPLSLRQWAFNTAPGSHVHLCLCCCCLGTQSQLTVLAPRPTCVAARPTATPDTSIELHTMLPPIAASLKLQLLLWMSSPAAWSYSLLHPATTSYSVERNQCRCPYQLLGLHSAIAWKHKGHILVGGMLEIAFYGPHLKSCPWLHNWLKPTFVLKKLVF